jgi:hypothetical protein
MESCYPRSRSSAAVAVTIEGAVSRILVRIAGAKTARDLLIGTSAT